MEMSKSKRFGWINAMAALAVFGLASTVMAQPYLYEYSKDGKIRVLNAATFQYEDIFERTMNFPAGDPFTRIYDAVEDPITGTVYALVGVSGCSTNRSLATIDPASGVAVFIGGTAHLDPTDTSPDGTLAEDITLSSLAFDASGQLYGGSGTCSPGFLGMYDPGDVFTIDKVTGARSAVAVAIDNSPNDFYRDSRLAFKPDLTDEDVPGGKLFRFAGRNFTDTPTAARQLRFEELDTSAGVSVWSTTFINDSTGTGTGDMASVSGTGTVTWLTAAESGAAADGWFHVDRNHNFSIIDDAGILTILGSNALGGTRFRAITVLGPTLPPLPQPPGTEIVGAPSSIDVDDTFPVFCFYTAPFATEKFFLETFDQYATNADWLSSGWQSQRLNDLDPGDSEFQLPFAGHSYQEDGTNGDSALWQLANRANGNLASGNKNRVGPVDAHGNVTSGAYINSDSDDASGDDDGDPTLGYVATSPSFDASGASGSLWLHFDSYVELNNNGQAIFEVFYSTDGGTAWTLIDQRVAGGRDRDRYPADGTVDAPGPTLANANGLSGRIDYDISAAVGQADVRLRFVQRGLDDDWFAMIDNICVDSIAPGGDTTLFTEDFAGIASPTGAVPAGWTVDAFVPFVSLGIDSDNDDAEEHADGVIDLTSSDLELTRDDFFQTVQTVGVRFNNLPFAQGATVPPAFIQFNVDESDTELTSLLIQGEASDNASTFTATANDITSRAKTTASVSWNNIPAWSGNDQGPDQATPDVSPILQEIVNRAGWVTGNSVVFIITGSGKRVAEAGPGADSAHLQFPSVPNGDPSPNPWGVYDATGRIATATENGAASSPTLASLTGGRSIINRLSQDGSFAIKDSDRDPDATDAEYLNTPAMDLSGLAEVFLHYKTEIVLDNTASEQVQVVYNVSVPTASITQTIYTYDNASESGEGPHFVNRVIPVPLVGDMTDVGFRFCYTSPTGNRWYWAVDDVQVSGSAATPSGFIHSATDWQVIKKPFTAGTKFFRENFNLYTTNDDWLASGWTSLRLEDLGPTDSQHADPFAGNTAPYSEDTSGSRSARWQLADHVNGNLASPPGPNRKGPVDESGNVTTGGYINSDSDAASGNDTGDSAVGYAATSPPFDLSGATGAVWLHFSSYCELNNNGEAIVDITWSADGNTWTNIDTRIAGGRDSDNNPADGTPDPPTADLTTANGFSGRMHYDISAAAGNSSVQLRFVQRGLDDDWFFMIDDICVDDQPPFGDTVLFAFEDFSGVPNGDTPTGWSVEAFDLTANPWGVYDDTGRILTATENGAASSPTLPSLTAGRGVINRLSQDGSFAIKDSDRDPDNTDQEYLVSPSIDASGFSTVILEFDSEIVIDNTASEQVIVRYNDTGEEAVIYTYDNASESGEGPHFMRQYVPVPIKGSMEDVQFAFCYLSPSGNRWYWAVDSVEVTAYEGLPPGAFGSPTFAGTTSTGNLTKITVENLGCIGTDFCIRARHVGLVDVGGSLVPVPSPWSRPVEFSIAPPAGKTLFLAENFDSLPLNFGTDEVTVTSAVPPTKLGWTHTTPAGWSIDNSKMGGVGIEEWEGWSFATIDFWNDAGGQGRSDFTLGNQTVAIGDSDERDDGNTPDGTDTTLFMPPLNVYQGGNLWLYFINDYRAYDEQVGELAVDVNGVPQAIATFKSHRRNVPERFAITGVPTNANYEFWFRYGGDDPTRDNRSRNDWWWAFDKVSVYSDGTLLSPVSATDGWMFYR